MTFTLRSHPEAAAVREALRRHPVVELAARRSKLPHDTVHEIVTEAVLDMLDVLGNRYVGQMSEVVARLTRVREAIHLVYEQVLSGSRETVDAGTLRHHFEELHAATEELADPRAWAEKHAASVPPLPVNPVVEYPGARPGLADKPTRAPQQGAGWEVRTVAKTEITLELDVNGTPYWRFPELRKGEVLHFPDYGYRAWLEPGTGAVVEELIVGKSVSDLRDLTQGEEALHAAADMGGAHATEGTQRAHGAGSPGLGFDSPYGVAHAARRINLSLENAGIEAWVRQLRDNAPPGVEYVYRTKTYKRGQNVAERVYTISAIADGSVHDLYQMALQVKEGHGIGNAAVEFLPEQTEIFAAAERYGAPLRTKRRRRSGATATSPTGAAPLPTTMVEPPPVLRRAMERADRAAEAAHHPSVERTGQQLETTVQLVDGPLLERYAVNKDPRWGAALDRLRETLGRLDEHVGDPLVDAAGLARIEEALEAFNRRAGETGTPIRLADILALTRLLAELGRKR